MMFKKLGRFIKKLIFLLISLCFMWYAYCTVFLFRNDLQKSLLNKTKKLSWEDDWESTKIPLNKNRIGEIAFLHAIERKSESINTPLLILLHGFPESSLLSWSETIPFLSKEFHVVAVDQRGYNNSYSPKRIKDYSLVNSVEDIVDVVKFYNPKGERKVYLMGHDFGAVVSWIFAITRSNFLDKLVIVNVPHPLAMRRGFNFEQIRKSWYALYYQIPYVPEIISSLRNYNYFMGMIVNSANPGAFSIEHVKKFRELWKKSLTTMINWYRTVIWFPHPIRKYKEEDQVVKTPTLIIWGERDIFLKKEMADLSFELCSNGILKSLPNTSHWVSHEVPKKLAKLVNEFLG